MHSVRESKTSLELLRCRSDDDLVISFPVGLVVDERLARGWREATRQPSGKGGHRDIFCGVGDAVSSSA